MNRPGFATLRRRPAWVAWPAAVWILLMPAVPSSASAAEGSQPPPPAARHLRAAAIGAGLELSPQAKQLVDWIALTGDHAGAPFIVVDKKRAHVFVFDADAQLRSHGAVLLGSALGDDSVHGIGSRPMAQILPGERTTPAGRFLAERGRNMQGEDIVWIDYDAAVSMHRVRTGNALERRAERLATSTIDDNRISYGCINVPAAFYETFIQPLFALSKAVVYVLPDLKAVNEVFGISPAATGVDASGSVEAPAQGGDGVLDARNAARKR